MSTRSGRLPGVTSGASSRLPALVAVATLTLSSLLVLPAGPAHSSTRALITVTGGEITDSGGFRYHAFTHSGDPGGSTSAELVVGGAAIQDADVLVVAGGGGAGRNRAGGGGAGGLLTAEDTTISATTHSVTVGGGGKGGSTPNGDPDNPENSQWEDNEASPGCQGEDSSFLSLDAVGGGGGGAGASTATWVDCDDNPLPANYGTNGGDGGSGGGAGYTGGSGGSGTGGQGNDGADAATSPAGGGGGAASAASSRDGGNGATSALLSSMGVATGYGDNQSGTVYFAGGGGGFANGLGGAGGGGAAGSAGSPHTGGGGGACNATSCTGGGPGGSGIVIVRYAVPTFSNSSPLSAISRGSSLEALSTTGLAVEVVAGSLPDGITISGTGFAGTATSVGTFTFTLRAYDQSDASIPAHYTDKEFTVTVNPVAPGIPTLDSATATSDGAVLSISPPDDTGGASISGYDWSTNDGSTWTALTSSSSNWVLSGLSAGTRYDVVIRARNSAGPGLKTPSTEIITLPSVSCGSLAPLGDENYRLLADATHSSGTFTLTPDAAVKKGAVWSQARADFSEDFCLTAEVYLGADDSGADGMAFVIQPLDSERIAPGGGLGYAGLSPSFVVELDTYDNGTADPTADHIALMKDGDRNDHSAWVGSGAVSLSNLEDGQWRSFSVEWDASESEVTVSLDGTTHFDAESVDLSTLLADYSDVAYWGFTAATGGRDNEQGVRNIRYQASPRENTAPQFVTTPSNSTVLRAATTSYAVTVSDDATTSSQWQTSIATTTNAVFDTPPAFSLTDATSGTVSFVSSATQLGSSVITLEVTDADGVTASHSFTVTVATTLPTPAPADNEERSGRQTAVFSLPPATPPAQTRFRIPAPATNFINQAPAPVSGPIVRGTVISPPDNPFATVSGVPQPVRTSVVGSTGVRVNTGRVNVGLEVQGDDTGRVVQNLSGNPELSVVRGGATRLSGSGLFPGSTVQAFLSFGNDESTQLARVPVAQDGTFDAEAALRPPGSNRPIPIGRQVLQVVTVDDEGNQTVVDMPINVAQPPPQPEAFLDSGEIPTVPVGQTVATRAGEPVNVSVIPVPDNKQTVIDGGDWTMQITAEGEGSAVQETPDGGVIVEFIRDQSAQISGSGFMPLTRADVWLFSEPTLLGSVDIDENGEFNGTVNVDGRVVTVGEHTLQLQGVGEDGYTRSANLGVVVNDAEGATATTEAMSLGWLWWLLAIVALVAAAGTALWWRNRGRTT